MLSLRVCDMRRARAAQVVFNPKDTNTFASASLDRTVKARPRPTAGPAPAQGRAAACGPPRRACAARQAASEVGVSLGAHPAAGIVPRQRRAGSREGRSGGRQAGRLRADRRRRARPRRAQVWSIGQPTPNFTLEGHEKGVNCVDYFNGGAAPRAAPCTLYPLPLWLRRALPGRCARLCEGHAATGGGSCHKQACAHEPPELASALCSARRARRLGPVWRACAARHAGRARAAGGAARAPGRPRPTGGAASGPAGVRGRQAEARARGRAGDRPYLISGADDRLVKVWDYQTKACVQTLEGHTHNVSAVCFHPELPIIVSGSEDGSVRVWHATTYRLENTLSYGLERLWALGYARGSNLCAPAAARPPARPPARARPRPPARPRPCAAGAAGPRRSAGLSGGTWPGAKHLAAAAASGPALQRIQRTGLRGLAEARSEPGS